MGSDYVMSLLGGSATSSSCASSSTAAAAAAAAAAACELSSSADALRQQGLMMQCSSPTPSARCDKRLHADPGRNARMAKENRERKKKYVAELEAKIAALEHDRAEARAHAAALQTDLAKATQEIGSLRTMLQNSSALAQVLAALGSSPAVSFSAPKGVAAGAATTAVKRAADAPEDDAPATKRASARRSKAAEADAASATATASATAAPTTVSTILPIQLNIHVHSHA